MNKKLLLGIFCLCYSGFINAQDQTTAENPIDEAFTELIESSNDYQGYKVVDYNEILNLKNKTTEYISELKDEITVQQNVIDQQQEQIDEIQEELESTQENLAAVNAQKDAINFLGIPFDKGTYMALMWGIIAVLVLALLFFIYKFRQSHVRTSEARSKYDTTEKEFEEYRAKALEKEQRLGRLLQDERNKASDK